MRVVELATVLMAPYAAQLLGDLGADVVKVEGDQLDAGRVLGGHLHHDLSGVALNLQRNKRSIQLDLKHPDGREAMLRLLDTADAFITNVRPAALARLGLDHASLRDRCPRLVYCEAHGFWSDSPDADRPAFDDIIQAETGLPRLLEANGQRTAFFPMTVADKASGLYIVIAVLSGLLQRVGAERGQRIEVAMFDAVLGFNLVEHIADAAVPGGKAGYVRILSRFRGPHATTDGWVAVMPYSDRHWRALYGAVGREHELDDPAFATLRARILNADRVYESLGRVMGERSTAEWVALGLEIGVPVAAVPTLDEILADPALHRGAIQQAEHPGRRDLPLDRAADPVRRLADVRAPPGPARRPGHRGGAPRARLRRRRRRRPPRQPRRPPVRVLNAVRVPDAAFPGLRYSDRRRVLGSGQLLDEGLELAQVAALVDAVGVGAVLADDRVAGVPVRARLGVEPVDVAGLVAHLLHHPGLRGVVVVAGVAEQQDGRLRPDVLAPLAPRTPRRRGRSRSGRRPRRRRPRC